MQLTEWGEFDFLAGFWIDLKNLGGLWNIHLFS